MFICQCLHQSIHHQLVLQSVHHVVLKILSVNFPLRFSVGFSDDSRVSIRSSICSLICQSVCSSTCPSVHSSVRFSVHFSVLLFHSSICFVRPFVNKFVSLFFTCSICMFDHSSCGRQSVGQFLRPSSNQSVCQYICHSIRQFVLLSLSVRSLTLSFAKLRSPTCS